MTAMLGMVEFKLADVGEGMHEAEILRWLVAPGDSVKVDQIIVEIQTDKAVVELPAPVTGKIAEIVAKVGATARVGDVLVRIAEQGNYQLQVTNEKVSPISNPQSSLETDTSPVPPHSSLLGRVRAAPAVRKKAVELGVDLALIKPSSPDGRILMDDVLNFQKAEANGQKAKEVTSSELQVTKQEIALEVLNEEQGVTETLTAVIEALPAVAETALPTAITQPAVPATHDSLPVTRQPLVGLRRRIAERMAESWRTIPQVTTFSEADGEELYTLRHKLKPIAEKRGINLTYLPFVVKALTLTLKQFPKFNATFDEASKEIIYKHYYHIGIATATPDGLLVPIIKDADTKSLAEIAAESSRLAEGARSRKLTQAELSGSTCTITNVGSFGGDTGTAIINPPEVAILGTGKLQEKAVARNGQVVVRHVLPLMLTFDHRLIDGADAGDFMNGLKQLLENPSQMLLDLV